jgi:ADP-heptose:LPS heptosyltransferase
MLAGGVRYRAGYGWGGAGFLLSREIDHPPGLHQVDRNLRLIQALGWKEKGEVFRRPRVFVSKAEEEEARARLLSLGVGEGERLVALHPGAGVAAKRWPAERYASLMAWLSRRAGLRLLLLGGPEERDLTDRVAALSGVSPVNLAGMLSLRGLMAILKQSHLMIGNDSGPTHLAAALGVPTVALFGGTNQAAEWAPIGERVHLVQPPSRLPVGASFGEGLMGEIQVEDVEKGIEGCGLA